MVYIILLVVFGVLLIAAGVAIAIIVWFWKKAPVEPAPPQHPGEAKDGKEGQNPEEGKDGKEGQHPEVANEDKEGQHPAEAKDGKEGQHPMEDNVETEIQHPMGAKDFKDGFAIIDELEKVQRKARAQRRHAEEVKDKDGHASVKEGT